MNAKEVEANRDCEKSVQNENNFPNSAAPPSYDEVIGTQQSLMNGRQHEGEYIRQQPVGVEGSSHETHIYGRK